MLENGMSMIRGVSSRLIVANEIKYLQAWCENVVVRWLLAFQLVLC
jgi:hypothetical protein